MWLPYFLVNILINSLFEGAVMSEKTKTRAELLATHYANKLQDMGVILTPKENNKISDEQTPEQKEKLKKAAAKLRTFYD